MYVATIYEGNWVIFMEIILLAKASFIHVKDAIIQELYAENTIVIKRETNWVSKFV